MADVSIRVTGQDSSAAATDKAADGIERIGKEADKTKPKLTELDGAARAAGRGANQLGDQMDKSKRDAEQLKTKLIELKATTVALGQTFAATGGKDAAVLKEFIKASTELGKTRRVARALDVEDPTSIVKKFGQAGEAGAKTFSSAFQGGVLDTLKALPSEAKIVIAGTAAAIGTVLAVGLVSSLNAALLTGIGVGGLVAGIKLAARDPAVAGAFTDLGSHVSSRLDDSVKPFKQELIDSAGIFEKSFDRVAPRIDTIFAGLSGEIKPLATGLAKAGENLAPGLQRAVAAAQPFIRDLANELPRLGTLIGQLFDSLAKAGPGAELTFRTILISIEALIKSFQIMIDLAAPFPNLIAAIGDKLGAWDISGAGGLVTVLTDLDKGAGDTGDSFDNLSANMYNTADAARELNDRFNDLFGIMLTQDQANLRVKQGMADLTKELQDGKRTLDENTQAGRDNVSVIFDQLDALNRKREADIAAGNGTVEATQTANAAYAGQVESIRRLLAQLGFTRGEIDALINKYQEIPHEIDTYVNTYYTDFHTSRQLGAFDPGAREERRYGKVFGGIVGAAQLGGIHSGLTKVGEGGWEYADLPMGTMVYPHANSAQMDAMAGNGSGGNGGAMVTVALVSSGGGDAFTEFINNQIRTGRLRLKVVNDRVVPA